MISLEHFSGKEIYTLHNARGEGGASGLSEAFGGKDNNGNELSFTNYYMQRNGAPFLGISGEFHFARCKEEYWEDELIKMKMAGINIISTYIFWIHHEEEKGCFRFEGRRNIRRFLELCQKHGLYAIARIGPFSHGEVRNGGYPDWLYGMDFETRGMDEQYLFYVRRFYEKLAHEMTGLYFYDGGPVIAAQLDNEYGHSAAPWEITTGISEEWVPSGGDGDMHLLKLQEIAREVGIEVPFYTCTAWGGAAAPTEAMIPLWGGYAFRPWLFYSYQGEHPVTPEYIYRDFHNNAIPETYNFEPTYQPETLPYACCEMGGGMACSYHYRFVLPYESVDAMANVKLASGCNLLGYYMFKGGTNPVGKRTPFLNESQMPKLSYDYQAAIGEFGQLRPSYHRLKRMHIFAKTWESELCMMKTVLPEGAELIAPEDVDTLRFALRHNGKNGFLFLNNYQDHVETKRKENCTINIKFPETELAVTEVSLAAGENAILPIDMDLGSIRLQYATVQTITVVNEPERDTYFFFAPDGMTPKYVFDKNTVTAVIGTNSCQWMGQTVVVYPEASEMDVFSVKGVDCEIRIVTLTSEQSMHFYLINRGQDKIVMLAECALLDDGKRLYLESGKAEETLYYWPEGKFTPTDRWENTARVGIFRGIKKAVEERTLPAKLEQVGPYRYKITFSEDYPDNVRDVLLSITYEGDIAQLFIDGTMIADNFCNGEPWETGLKLIKDRLKEHPLILYITPIKDGAKVNVESVMAGRKEETNQAIAGIKEMVLKPLYEYVLG